MIEYSDLYTDMGNEIIRAFKEFQPIIDSNCRVAFMRSSISKQSGGKLVLGECKKLTGDIHKRFVPHDYLVIIYEPNTTEFSEKQIKALLWHELKHIRIERKSDEWKFSIQPHDLEDFRELINKVGANWDEEGAAIPDIITGAIDG